MQARAGTDESDEDDRLLAQAGRGDRQAFSRLADRHIDRAHRVALRMLGDGAEAEDVVQDAFLRVWQKAADWKPGRARFSTWLYRVVVNLSVDRQRKHQRRRTNPIEDGLDFADPAPGAEDDLWSSQQAALVRGAVAELPERQRAAVVLTYTEGLANADAAEALGISVGALESLLVRARKTLRGQLGGATR